jgi:hypothetical protein
MRPVDWLFVIGLLLFAAALRLTGIAFGQPNPQYNRSLDPLLHEQTVLHPDEYFYVAIPYEMLVRGRKLPHFYENPSFLINLNFVTFALTGSGRDADVARWQGLTNRSFAPFPLYVIGRVYSALGGLLTVAGVYAAAKLLAGKRGAALAGLLTAISMPLVQHAHYSTTSSLATGFSVMCLAACLMCLKRPNLPRLLWLTAGICAGLAAGNRYNAAAIAIVVFLTGLVALNRHRTQQTAMLVMMGYLAVPLTFLLTTPGAIFNFDEFWQQFRFIYGRFASSGGVMSGLFYEYRYILIFGTGVLAVPLILAGLYALRRPRWQALAAGISLIYLLAYSLVVLNTSTPAIGDQLTLPAIPVWIVLAGIGAGWLLNRLPKHRLMLPLLAALVILLPAIPTLQWLHVLRQPDTRQLMQAWIYANIPRGTKIHLGGSYNVALDAADYQVTRDDVYHMTLAQLGNSGVDYVVYSDAVAFASRRNSPAGLLGLGYYEYGTLAKRAWIERPHLFGETLLPNNSVYWHNPGIYIYCMRAEHCPATSGVN